MKSTCCNAKMKKRQAFAGDRFQTCEDCGKIRCVRCGGDEVHHSNGMCDNCMMEDLANARAMEVSRHEI